MFAKFCVSVWVRVCARDGVLLLGVQNCFLWTKCGLRDELRTTVVNASFACLTSIPLDCFNNYCSIDLRLTLSSYKMLNIRKSSTSKERWTINPLTDYYVICLPKESGEFCGKVVVTLTPEEPSILYNGACKEARAGSLNTKYTLTVEQECDAPTLSLHCMREFHRNANFIWSRILT